ncbi:MAG: tetratricopeptide repeat protein, partial [Candidatus Marinimicrobia bacterium]|nr:tetratricopeptide repeat protein [Candidatus Neomarinimicrobiota bacterium]
MKVNFKQLYILIFYSVFGFSQNSEPLDILAGKAEAYYMKHDYTNAIILYEDLLAVQEVSLGESHYNIAQTMERLGELYAIAGMKDISDYYYKEAIILFEKNFQSRKSELEAPIINLIKIYSQQNDWEMVEKLQIQLQSLTRIFQDEKLGDSLYSDPEDSLIIAINDRAIELMEKGRSFIAGDLYYDATLHFTEAFNYRTANLHVNFLKDFFPEDSLILANLIGSFSLQLQEDTTGTPYFFSALLDTNTTTSLNNIRRFIELQPKDLRGTLLYANLLVQTCNYFEALYQFRKILWIEPKQFDALFGTANCL